MKILAGMRRSGKTTALVQATLENKGVLLVPTTSERDRLKKEYPYLEAYTADEWSYKARGTEEYYKKDIYIDNADLVLAHQYPTLRTMSLFLIPELLVPSTTQFEREMYGIFVPLHAQLQRELNGIRLSPEKEEEE